MVAQQVYITDSGNAEYGTGKPFPVTSALTTSTMQPGAQTTVGASAISVVAANANRKTLILQNTGAGNVRVGPSSAGLTADPTTGIQIIANGGAVVFEPPYIPTNAFFAIREGGTSSAVLAIEAT